MKKRVWIVFAFLLCGPLGHVQEIPRADLSVGVSNLFIAKGYTINISGPSAALAVNANHGLGLVGDFGAYFGHIPQSFTGEL